MSGTTGRETKRGARNIDIVNSAFSQYLATLSLIYEDFGKQLVLRRPASKSSIDKLERSPGVIVPELRQAWLATDGTKRDSVIFARPGFLVGYRLMPVAEVVDEKKLMAVRAKKYGTYKQPEPRDPRIRPGWFDPAWLPFAEFGDGSDLLILDLAPRDPALNSQVIAYSHDPDRIEFVSSSFVRFLNSSLLFVKNNAEELLEQL